MIERLARRVAQAHDAASPDFSHGGADAMRAIVDSMEESLRESPPAPTPEIDAHLALLREALQAHAALIDARRACGKVRPCHGDLNLRNICLYEGEPTPFDGIEFSDDISTIDVLYDIAFLLMDLWRARLPDLANLAFNRYLDARIENDWTACRCCPSSCRCARRSARMSKRRRGMRKRRGPSSIFRASCFSAAHGGVVAIGGFSGSGKSSVAAALAPLLAPGARRAHFQ